MEDDIKLYRIAAFAVIAVAVVLLGSGIAEAFTAPSPGTFGYPVYDVAVNKMGKGPFGYIAGFAAVVFGFILMIKGQYLIGILAFLGGSGLAFADSIVQTMGAVWSETGMEDDIKLYRISAVALIAVAVAVLGFLAQTFITTSPRTLSTAP
jgi:hypothetical protein